MRTFERYSSNYYSQRYGLTFIMTHLIDLFIELREIIYNYGVCEESSNAASIIQTSVSHYFTTATPHLLPSDQRVLCDLVERVDHLMTNIIGVDLSTHNGFWISRLNNLQTDLFTFLRKIKMCGRESIMNFGNWHLMYGSAYTKQSQAYQAWVRLKDQRNQRLGLSNLPITRHFKGRMNVSSFKGVYITKTSGSGKSSMKRSFPEETLFTPIKLQKTAASLTTRNFNSTASHLACAILPYDCEMGISLDDWRYAQESFNDPDDIRLMNIKKSQAMSQYHKLEIVRLRKKYSIGESRRYDVCLKKLKLLCDWLDDENPIIVD